jgi:hypothetical protein
LFCFETAFLPMRREQHKIEPGFSRCGKACFKLIPYSPSAFLTAQA